MLHPVGNMSPSVYWRRRAMMLAVLVLAAVSGYALFFRGGSGGTPTGSQGFTPSSQTSPVDSSPASSSSSAASSSALTRPSACTAAQLSVQAATSAASYPAGSKPMVALVVTNNGPSPCVQDLSDSQIELRVYNGSARVWGSHDCAIQPGTAPATLPVGKPIRREIEWSGLSSRESCAGTRTHVGAGKYTLYALLSGHQGSSATFTLTG